MKYLSLIFLILLFAVLSKSQTASVIAENANLRGTPSEQGKVVETLPNGTAATVIMQKGAWFLVQTESFVGWIHGNTIKVEGSQFLINGYPPKSTPLKTTTSKSKSAVVPSDSRTYLRGSRGGCYYINSNGKKTYVDRSLCN